MKMTSFRVVDFRSILDSGQIPVEKMAVLVGRNESGKTNLLLALESLNPVDELRALTFEKDFPRTRLPGDYKESAMVVRANFLLTAEEFEQVKKIWPRVNSPKLSVARTYDGQRTVTFDELAPLRLSKQWLDETADQVADILSSVRDDFGKQSQAEQARSQILTMKTHALSDVRADASVLKQCLDQVAITALAVGGDISHRVSTAMEKLARKCQEVLQDGSAQEGAFGWILERMPRFIYLTDYPDLDGHQDIRAFVEARTLIQRTEAHRNFERLCKVAGLDPAQLIELAPLRPETRQQLVNRAGASVTAALRRYWQDRKLKVRFNLDGTHFDTLVSDPNNEYDVEVNLNERSRGFKWFFSFWIAFDADTQGGDKSNAILLLDEPGLFLHALAQKDLVSLLTDRIPNQILYTTHSPFMIPVDRLAWVKTVVNNEVDGTHVPPLISGDDKTLFPLQAALGHELCQSMFINQRALVVESLSDYWVLAGMREVLHAQRLDTWPEEVRLWPAGNTAKVPFLVALLSVPRLPMVVLLEGDREAKQAQNDLVSSKLLKSNLICLISELACDQKNYVELEDLFAADDYDRLVREAHADELKSLLPTLNERIPGRATRYVQGWSAIGLNFDRARVAALLSHKFAQGSLQISSETLLAFSELFALLRRRLESAVISLNSSRLP